MKRLAITFAMLTFMFGCATLPKNYIPVGHSYTINSSNSPCQDLYEGIAKKWGYHQAFKSCYYYNEKLISFIVEKKNCFVGLSEFEIKQIFGEPSKITESSLSYTLSKECSEIDTLFSSKSLRFKMMKREITDLNFQEADVHY